MLAAIERLFGLADLAALEVAKLCREALQGGADQGQRLDEVGVAVARDDLGAGGVDAEAEAFADAALRARVGPSRGCRRGR